MVNNRNHIARNVGTMKDNISNHKGDGEGVALPQFEEPLPAAIAAPSTINPLQ